MKDQGRTRFLILGLLAEGPCSGYDIRRITMLRFRFFWNESYGQIYPCLKRLEAGGHISRQAAVGRGRVVYALADSGRAQLAEWLTGATQSESARYEAILKFYFSFAMPGADTRRLLEEFRSRQLESLSQLKAFDRELRSIPDPHHNHHLALATIELGQSSYQVWADWAEKQLTALAREKPQNQGEPQ